MKNVPVKGHPEYDAFFDKELEKIKYGITIDGFYIHGWLYWHLNYWKIYQDVLDPISGESIRVLDYPIFRDNEWLFAKYLKQAETEKKGICLIGGRRISKSVFMSSYIARSATIYKGSENVIVGNNKDDLGVLTSLLEKGLSAMHEHFLAPRINDDWRKEVTLGHKDKKGKRNIHSTIFIRNTDGGSSSEVVAGTTPKSLVLDEIGKSPFLDAFNAAKPSFASQFGWRCVPLLFGTGGDFENGKDAEKMFNDPISNNMISMILSEEGNKETCIFIPGFYSLEFPKDKTTLGDYLNAPEGSELYEIPFEVTNIERTRKLILEEREKLSKSKDSNALLKYKMYYPITSDECFLTETGNNFPIEAAKIALDLIMRKPELQGVPTRLYRDVDGTIIAERDTKKKPIWDYPHIAGSNLNAPIIIYEPPMSKNPPRHLYIGGLDPYNQNTSSSSDSLGSLYIYKRMYDPVAGTYQQRIVASYVARPETMKEYHENAELLIEYYNAIVMMENEGTSFLQYMDSKNKGHYLADGFSLLTEISPNTTIRNRPKGLPATVPVIRHCMNLFVEYCKEEIVLGYNDKDEPINALGIMRITDPLLLKEIIQYRTGSNVDRMVAFRHILAYDKHLEKNYSVINVQKEGKKLEMPKVGRGPFFKTFSNPFGLR